MIEQIDDNKVKAYEFLILIAVQQLILGDFHKRIGKAQRRYE
jgi:hypothetical protein